MAADRQEFDHDAAERVLRRAIDLAEQQTGDTHHGLSESALIEAAEELGVDPAAVRLAAAEERVGLLATRHGRVDRLVGPAVVSATRVIDLPSDEAMDAVDRWLRRVGSLRRQRRSDTDGPGAMAVYTRRSDAAAGLQRTVRSVAGQEQLGRVGRLRVDTYPLDPEAPDDERSLVVLSADLGVERTAVLAGGSTVAVAGSTSSVAAVLAGVPWVWIGIPASAAVGLGAFRVRAHGLPDVRMSLDGVLDRIAAGDLPGGVLDDVRSRLRSGLSKSRRTA